MKLLTNFLAGIGAMFLIAFAAGSIPGIQFTFYFGPTDRYVAFLASELARVEVKP